MAPRRPLAPSSKALAKMARECGLSPLCEPCGWRERRVPRAWRQQLPGTPYDADEPLAGLEVVLRGDDRPSRVVGPATPMGPSLLQMGRVSRRYECQGAVMVKTPLGLETPVPRSVVRERARLADPRRATCRCTGLPYPHRIASSPLCEQHPENAAALRERARDAYEEGDDERAEKLERRAAALDRRAEKAYREAEQRAGETRADYQKRITRAKKHARSQGWRV